MRISLGQEVGTRPDMCLTRYPPTVGAGSCGLLRSAGGLDGKLIGQAHERGQVQLLGAQAAVDAGGFDIGLAQQQLERIAQGLAALVERFAHHALSSL